MARHGKIALAVISIDAFVVALRPQRSYPGFRDRYCLWPVPDYGMPWRTSPRRLLPSQTCEPYFPGRFIVTRVRMAENSSLILSLLCRSVGAPGGGAPSEPRGRHSKFLDQPHHVAMRRSFMDFDISVIPEGRSGKVKAPTHKKSLQHHCTMKTLGNTHELGAKCAVPDLSTRSQARGGRLCRRPTGALVRAADSITSCGKIGACARPTRNVPPTESLTSKQWR